MTNLVDITDREPNPDLIRHLEMCLDHAKSGKLRSYIAVFGWADDSWSHSWVKDPRNSWLRMAGELSLTNFDFNSEAIRGTGSAFDRIVDGEE